MKPLNPLEQQSVSVVQGEKDNKSTEILGELKDKTKVFLFLTVILWCSNIIYS